MINHASNDYESHSFIRSSSESRCHRNFILKLAVAYHKSGFEVKADHIKGFESPNKVCMMIPDIIANNGEQVVIVEVETRSSVGTKRDRRQRRVFGEWAKKDKEKDFRRETTF